MTFFCEPAMTLYILVFSVVQWRLSSGNTAILSWTLGNIELRRYFNTWIGFKYISFDWFEMSFISFQMLFCIVSYNFLRYIMAQMERGPWSWLILVWLWKFVSHYTQFVEHQHMLPLKSYQKLVNETKDRRNQRFSDFLMVQTSKCFGEIAGAQWLFKSQ